MDSQPLVIQIPGIEDTDGGKYQQLIATGLLKKISKTLTTLIKEVKDMNSNLNDLKERTVAKTVVSVADDKGDPLRETLGQLQIIWKRSVLNNQRQQQHRSP